LAPLLIDDHLLVRVLAASAPSRVQRARRAGELWTSGLWYLRAARALQSSTITGALSGELADLPPPAKAQAVAGISRLPDDIGLMSLRELVPVMSELLLQHRLNVLSLEALGAAVHLGAEVLVAAENDGPLLRAAVTASGRRYATA
jgi:hypothetical protein